MAARRYVSLVSSDLEDEAADDAEKRKETPGPLRMVYPDHPCRMPFCCDFDGRECTFCGKKSGPHPETSKIQHLAHLMDGGLTLAPHDLAVCQWEVLAFVRMPRRLLG